jgi:hypothetical protein
MIWTVMYEPGRVPNEPEAIGAAIQAIEQFVGDVDGLPAEAKGE